MKVVIVSCYKHLDYVRSRTLRAGFTNSKDTELIIIKNNKENILRYFEVAIKLIKNRFTNKPDVYVITFRGYEILPFVLLLSRKIPTIFDEFINPIEWAIFEHHKFKPDGFIGILFTYYYRNLVKRCTFILADTKAHAEYSAKINQISLTKYRVIPVGTDEELFKPLKPNSNHKKFRVFHYGKGMLPLHGLQYILDSAVQLKENKDIEFEIVGSKKESIKSINAAKKLGAHIIKRDWINFSKLPQSIANSDLCLGGPFGNTVQSQLVIGGKTFQFMACAKPTIVGKNKIKGIFIDQKNCLLVRQGNSTELANKILWAYKNKRKLVTIGKNAKTTFDKHYSLKTISENCQSLLNDLSQV